MSRIWEAVETLSPQQRAAVQLQCREGLSTKEIAAVLNTSEATVRVHLHRAFAALPPPRRRRPMTTHPARPADPLPARGAGRRGARGD